MNAARAALAPVRLSATETDWLGVDVDTPDGRGQVVGLCPDVEAYDVPSRYHGEWIPDPDHDARHAALGLASAPGGCTISCLPWSVWRGDLILCWRKVRPAVWVSDGTTSWQTAIADLRRSNGGAS